MNGFAVPLDKERKQTAPIVVKVKQFPAQDFAVGTRARAGMRSINQEACP